MREIEVSEKDIREIIINGARSIFVRFGFENATMNEIARAAHKAKSTLYYYFSKKEDIFLAVIEKEGRLLLKEIMRAIEIEDTPQKKMRSYIITRTKILNQLGNFYKVIRDEYYNHYSAIEKTREKHFEDERKMIISILNDGIHNGIFVFKDLLFTAEAIISCIRGFEFAWATENDFSIIEKKIDHLLELLFYGLIKR